MKFGKKLRDLVDQCDEEWRPNFINYKELKKCINPPIRSESELDAASKDSDSGEGEDPETQTLRTARKLQAPPAPEHVSANLTLVRQAETQLPTFFSSFRREVDKVNDFYLDKEEDYIIEHRQLSVRVEECSKPSQMALSDARRIEERLTCFHRELVRLENFSTINYTGFRKILKKHDKKTGRRVHQIYLGTVLITPFYIRDTVRKLIANTEGLLGRLRGVNKFRREPDRKTANSSHTAFTMSPKSMNILSKGRGKKKMGKVTEMDTMEVKYKQVPLSTAALEREMSTETFQQQSLQLQYQGQQQFYQGCSYPRPYAFITARSALWRVFREARLYGAEVRGVLGRKGPDRNIPIPPERLVEEIDGLLTAELGIFEPFLRAVTQPSNYCIASEQDFSIGFFVLENGTPLQLFRKEIYGGACVTRNMFGRAEMRCYESIEEDRNMKEDEDKKDEILIRETRRGMTTGPWPSVKAVAGVSHVVWEPQGKCVILYVWTPSLMEDYLPMFEIEEANRKDEEVLKVKRIKGNIQHFGRLLC